MWFLLIEN